MAQKQPSALYGPPASAPGSGWPPVRRRVSPPPVSPPPPPSIVDQVRSYPPPVCARTGTTSTSTTRTASTGMRCFAILMAHSPVCSSSRREASHLDHQHGVVGGGRLGADILDAHPVLVLVTAA